MPYPIQNYYKKALACLTSYQHLSPYPDLTFPFILILPRRFVARRCLRQNYDSLNSLQVPVFALPQKAFWASRGGNFTLQHSTTLSMPSTSLMFNNLFGIMNSPGISDKLHFQAVKSVPLSRSFLPQPADPKRISASQFGDSETRLLLDGKTVALVRSAR